MSGRLFSFRFNCLIFLLIIFLSFIDLWWFIVVAWICREYCRIVLFWIFLFLEGFGWGKWRYGKIKRLVEINRKNKTLSPNLGSPLQYNFTNHLYLCKSKWTMNFLIHLLSQNYIVVGEVILLKTIQIMANWRFFIDPSQPIPNSQIIFIFIFIVFIFFFLWNVLPRFPSLNVHPLLPDKSRSVLSSKSYPFVK